ncbi:MAG: LLM class F420-dependent oxidoreductase, partial [Cellulosimicrobium funkei]
VDSAKLWDLPDETVEIGVAVSGPQSIERFAPLADHLVTTEPEAGVVQRWSSVRESAELAPSRVVGQMPICWDPDEETAVARAHEQFRWFGGGWRVNADLPTTEAFEAATAFVRPEDVAASIPCGPDLDAVVEAASAWWEEGFTDLALVQVGEVGQREFLETAAGPLLEKLRAAAPSS